MRRPGTAIGIERRTLEILYLEKRLSSIKIGAYLNVSKTRVLYWLRKYGIGRRSLSESHIGQICWAKGTKGRLKPNAGSFKRGNRPWNKGKPYPLGRELWLKTREKRMHSLRRQTTRPEKTFKEICVKHTLPYRYTGNGTFWIGNLNPDFINVDGKKLAIDIFGDYWHSPLLRPNMATVQDPRYRRRTIESQGWQYIPLWENELKSPSAVRIIQEKTI